MNNLNQMASIFSVVISVIKSPTFFFYAKVIFLGIGGIFLFLIILLLKKTKWLEFKILEDITEITTHRPYGAQKTFKQWAKIIKKLEEKKETEYRMAIIEADNLLGDILRKMGYKGETLRSLLEQINSKILPNIEDIWYAHNLRNNIVHDSNYDLNLENAKKAMSIYERAFRDLQLF